MEAKVETCLIAKYLWEMLDATLEGSQFLLTFLYISMKFKLEMQNFLELLHIRSGEKTKTNGLFTNAVCLVPWQQRKSLKGGHQLPLLMGITFSYPTVPPLLHHGSVVQKPYQPCQPNQPTVHQPLRGPGAMANAIGVEVVDGANHLLHYLKPGNPKNLGSESEPREVHNLDEYVTIHEEKVEWMKLTDIRLFWVGETSKIMLFQSE